MNMPVNCDTFDKMVDEDIEWLKESSPDNLERGHIIQCLDWSKKYYREVHHPNLSHDEWNC